MGAIEYLPFDKRKPDAQYRELLLRILDDGINTMPQQEEQSKMVMGHQMRFELKNGFPMITERNLLDENRNKKIFHMALGELFAFLNGARTQKELESFGCRWWKPWITKEKCEKRGLKEGDLGPGSYGPAWRNFPTSEGAGFDQISHIIQQINELPRLRTHFVSPWIPQYTIRGKEKQQKVVVAPCHGWLHWFIFPETNQISLHHFQRSADVPVGLVCNLIQYGALLLMVAQVTGYKADALVYTISDAHFYNSQLNDVQTILEKTTAQCLPTVKIDPNVTDLFSFRQEHFTVSDYFPQLPFKRIPTPV